MGSAGLVMMLFSDDCLPDATPVTSGGVIRGGPLKRLVCYSCSYRITSLSDSESQEPQVVTMRQPPSFRPFAETVLIKQLSKLILALMLLSACSSIARDSPSQIDALTASPANFTVLLENEHVRVLEYVLEPGERDQWHTHPPKVSYVLSGGILEIHLENGESFLAEEKAGEASWADVRGRHYVKNVGASPVRILLVEDKAAAPRRSATSIK